jgi:AraC-like DNA-binding protein
MLPGRRGQVWRYQPEYRRPRHFHNEPELNFVVAGAATFGTGSGTLTAGPGDLLCWPPGLDHELLSASADLDLFVVALTPELCERALGSGGAVALAGPPLVSLPREAGAELRALLSAPAHSPEASLGDEHVARLWNRAHQARLTVSSGNGLGRRVLRSVLQQPELDRRERAHIMAAYPSELSRQFHQEVGIKLSTYRTRLRLLRFIDLVDSRQSLLRAALGAGFGSYSQCHRAFSAAFACTPRVFFGSSLRLDMADEFAPLGV